MGGPAEIHVLARDAAWMAVEKPAGMSVHNHPGKDLISRVAQILPGPGTKKHRLDDGPETRIQPVHRLDRETSGVILLALDLETLRYLSRQFEEDRVVKTYIALVHGRVPDPGGPGAFGLWDHPLAKTSGGRTDPAGKGRLVPARTGFRILERSFHYTLLEIRLFTGRQHQIRRHAKLSGHPVAGDTRYGSKRSVAWLVSRRSFDRLGLHAHGMTFIPPGRTDSITVTSRGIPLPMLDLMHSDEPEP